MVDKINREKAEHIVTIEDPIEYVHQHKKCVVNQRELHADTYSFKAALKSVLRQDPDKVLIGEMRDLETIEAALTIAETGHLTFGTLHTNSAVQTVNRIIDVFPPHQQAQIRAQLSFVLEGVLCQMLLRRANGQGRVLVLEIMIPNAAIRNLIREDKLHQIYGMMQAGKEKSGMQTMNESLLQHYLRRNVTQEQALGASTQPEELLQMMQRAQAGQSPYLAAGAAARR
jgi:twitching motility protein PilT